MTAAIKVANIGLAHDGDDGLLFIFVFFGVAGRSSCSNGQESDDDELYESETLPYLIL